MALLVCVDERVSDDCHHRIHKVKWPFSEQSTEELHRSNYFLCETERYNRSTSLLFSRWNHSGIGPTESKIRTFFRDLCTVRIRHDTKSLFFSAALVHHTDPFPVRNLRAQFQTGAGYTSQNILGSILWLQVSAIVLIQFVTKRAFSEIVSVCFSEIVTVRLPLSVPRPCESILPELNQLPCQPVPTPAVLVPCRVICVHCCASGSPISTT